MEVHLNATPRIRSRRDLRPVACAAGLALVQRTRIRLNFDYAMKVVANEAVRRAKQEHQVMLDFSPASVQRLEEDILAKLHEAHLKTPMSEQNLSRLSIRWGAYLGETLKRRRPGRWHRDSQKVGRGTTPVVFEPVQKRFPARGSTNESPTARKIM